MPYGHYRRMSDEDVASVIVYLRSLPAVRQSLPQTEIIFPVKYLIRSVPQPLTTPVTYDDLEPKDQVRRGERLVHLAGCIDCHTPAKQGQPIAGLDWAAGLGFPGLGALWRARTLRRTLRTSRSTTRRCFWR